MANINIKFIIAALIMMQPIVTCYADTPPPVSDVANDVEPSSSGIGVTMQIGRRQIEIHHQSTNQSLGKTYYFHTPLFLLDNNPSPIPSLPDIIFKPPRVAGDLTYLTFHIILSDPQFRKDALAFTIANAPEFKGPGAAADPANTIVNPWPLKTLTVFVEDTDTRRIFASKSLSGEFKSNLEYVDTSLGFTKDNLAAFLSAQSNGDLSFVYVYTFKNAAQHYAVAVSHAQQSISKVLKDTVASMQTSPDAPIFQTQADEFKSRLVASYESEVKTDTASLIPDVTSQLMEHYLTGTK